MSAAASSKGLRTNGREGSGPRGLPADGDQATMDLGRVYVRQRRFLLAEARRKGFLEAEAEDLVQDFFAEILAKRHLRVFDASLSRLGSFISFLFRRFLQKELRRQSASKRGGGQKALLLDAVGCRCCCPPELVDWRTPAVECEREHLARLLETGLKLLKQECARKGKAEQYRDAMPWLLNARSEASCYGLLSHRWGVSRAAAKMTLFRMRRRLRDLVTSGVPVETKPRNGQAVLPPPRLRVSVTRRKKSPQIMLRSDRQR